MLRLLAFDCAWIVSVADGILRVLLFLLFEANLCSCAHNSKSSDCCLQSIDLCFDKTSGHSFTIFHLSPSYISTRWTYEETNPALAQKSGNTCCGAVMAFNKKVRTVEQPEHQLKLMLNFQAELGTLHSYKSKETHLLMFGLFWIECGQNE